ncbi:MAG TPA: GNAT family N-acetyltransferase [Anaeromyxobacteraceae bacterium]|nr:GNAT family N-acetyltransferase [Anaeromyxobacteraceae bacterium]
MSPARVRDRSAPALTFGPLTARRFGDLERLFGPNGACAGCWCMWWKTTRAQYRAGRGEGNRRALARLVRSGAVPGLLAYAGAEPVGWCAVEPRRAYPRLARSRLLAPVDDAEVWSVTCFFVARPFRRQGVTRALLEAAAAHARRRGARTLEGYPVDAAAKVADASVYTGLATAFRAEGFEEVARRSPRRPIVRLALRPARAEGPRKGRRDSSRARRIT